MTRYNSSRRSWQEAASGESAAQRDYAEETRHLFKLLREGSEPGALQQLNIQLQAQATSDLKEENDLYDDTKEKILFVWRTEFPQAAAILDQIALCNRGLIVRWINDALEQEPFLDEAELTKAAERGLWFSIADYEIERGNQFSTVASTYIRNAVSRYRRSSEVSRIRKAAQHVRLDAQLRGRFDRSRHEIIPDLDAQTPEQELIQRERQAVMHTIFDVIRTDIIDDREYEILLSRFEAVSGKKMSESRKQIGRQLSISGERVRKLEVRALRKIKEFINIYNYRSEQEAGLRRVQIDDEPVATPGQKSAAIARIRAAVCLYVKISGGIDVSVLNPEERQVANYRMQGKSLMDIAALMGTTRVVARSRLTKAHRKLGIDIQRHPDHEQYGECPSEAIAYAEHWQELTSFERCVAHLHFKKKTHGEIAIALRLSRMNVRNHLKNVRKKLGIRVSNDPPEQYKAPPSESGISLEEWNTLGRLEKIVLFETIVRPKPCDDRRLSEELNIRYDSIRPTRFAARRKLQNVLEKTPAENPPENNILQEEGEIE